MKVLIVEDEEEIERSYRRMLSKLLGAVDIDAVGTQPRAIHQMTIHSYDLVLCDGFLALGTGLGVWEWMKKNDNSHLKRIVLETLRRYRR